MIRGQRWWGIFAFFVWLSSSAALAATEGWDSAALRSAGDPVNISGEAVGYVNNGSLRNGTRLARFGDGFVHVGEPDHSWGTGELVELIEHVASRVRAEFPYGERLQLRDLSKRNGGPLTCHKSHQNGLDVDMAYFRRDRAEQDPTAQRGFLEYMVLGTRASRRLSKNFDVERNWALVRHFAESGRVSRIFMDARIIREFKDRYGDSTEILKLLDPEAEHANHLHVRIGCPEGDRRCRDGSGPTSRSGSSCRRTTRTRTLSMR